MIYFFSILFCLSVFFILYTYFGYPVLIWGISVFCPTEEKYPEYFPSVTLLITAYNEEKVIRHKIEQSLNLEYPSTLLQIIVAADGSDDKTVDIVKEFASRGVVLSYDHARRGKMSAINHAMEKVKNEIVIFSDANNDYSQDVICKIVEPYSNLHVGAVTGCKSIYKEDSSLSNADGLYWKYESFIKLKENRVGCCLGVSGEIFSMRKRLFTPPPTHIINDDFYMAMDIIKKGYNIIYAPFARSFERISQSEQDEITRRTRIFTGQVQLVLEQFKMLPFNRPFILFMMMSHKFFRILLPVAMIVSFVANFLALVFIKILPMSNGFALYEAYLLIFLCLQTLFYILAFLGMLGLTGGLLGRILYFPTFLVNGNVAALLGIVKYFAGTQTVLWEKVKR